MEAYLFLAAPICLAILMVGIHAYLGLHVIEREVIFIDISLSQVAALGSSIGMLLFADDRHPFNLILSLIFCLIAALILSLLRHFEKKLSQEILIGITYALASSVLILVLDKSPHGTEHLKEAFIGNILFVTWHDVALTAATYFIIGLIHFIYRHHFWAASKGDKKSLFWDFLFYFLFGIVITFSTHHAGVLVVFAILVVPAALACRLAKTLKNRLFISWKIGVLSVLVSFFLSYKLDWPAGAGIVATLAGGFFLTLISLLGYEQLQKK